MASNERQMFKNHLLSSLSMYSMYVRDLSMYEITKSTTNAVLDRLYTIVDFNVLYCEYNWSTNVSNMSDDNNGEKHVIRTRFFQ